jgi:hypothetical protein
MWYDDIKTNPELFIDDTIYIENKQGTSEIGKLVKEYEDGICDVIIKYPFGDCKAKAKRIPTEKYGSNWFELI